MNGEAAASLSVTVSHLDAYYGLRQILKDVSFDVRAGEILAIMGGSGSGKTTLMNAVLGLVPAARGSIQVLGTDMISAPESEVLRLRTRIGVAFQSGALFGSMTVGDNIALPLREHTRLDEAIIGIITRLKLEQVALPGTEKLMPAQLSGGMVKRASLARAIALDPELLFCDEPTSGLDPPVAAGIDELILRLRRAMGMTLVVVTHDLDSAFKIADRICVLDNGEVLAVDRVDSIRANPDERIQALLHRRREEEILDTDSYLRRLTGEDGPGQGIRP